MNERWTNSATARLAAALDEARRRSHQALEPEHLLWADLLEDHSLLATAAGACELSVPMVKAIVDRRLHQLPVATRGTRTNPRFSERLRERVAEARRAPGRNPDLPLDWPATITSLMARHDDPLVVDLRAAGLETATLAPIAELPPQVGQEAEKFFADEPLQKYCRDLTALAAEGRIEPAIGRDHEVEQIILILAQRTTNNPVLLGEPGVGKTAIVEGLACRMARGEVARLAGRRLLELDLNSLLAGASYRGEFEDRLKRVVDAVVQAEGKYVLFVDEVHTLMGAGSAGSGPDAANLLKPPLARGQLRMIGATTYAEYKQHLELDAAFTRRFQVVRVAEPTPKQVREIMGGISGHYAKFHGVQYEDAALHFIVELSDRYIGSTHFPDKAIKVIDRAGVIASLRGGGVGDQTPCVDKSAVIDAVAQISHLPRHHIAQDQETQLSTVEKALQTKLVGQAEPMRKLVEQLRTAFPQFRSNPQRPRGVLLFTGPAAVGKTAAARLVAQHLYASEEQLVALDMAGFSDKATVTRLIGSPIGYEGHREGGKLTEAVWRTPFSLVLLENIELAHADVLNLLATACEEGALTDSAGKRVRMNECLFVMTSRQPVERALPPRFRSLVQEIISFEKLSVEHAVPLARLALQLSAEHLAKSLCQEGEPPKFELHKSVEEAVRTAFDPELGALSVERHVDRQIFTELVRQGSLEDWSAARKVIVSHSRGHYNFKVSL